MANRVDMIGRARTVLVFGQGESCQGVISAILVRVKRRRKGRRLTFAGTAEFAEATMDHVAGVILPIVDRVHDALGLPARRFEISAVNLAAASCQDAGIRVSGFSADLSILLAMLSATLQVPIREDFVATGHVGSITGDITVVGGIPAKLKAVEADESIDRFIYPDLCRDSSMDHLAPKAKGTSLAAVLRVRKRLVCRTIRGIDELIREAFAREYVVFSALRQGFFHLECRIREPVNPLDRLLAWLTDDNEQRFWDLLQELLSAGNCDRAVNLLDAYAASFSRRRRYPPGFGTRLLQLVCALPPVTRRFKLTLPLLSFSRCAQLVRVARKDDVGDVPILFDAVRGKVPGEGSLTNARQEHSSAPDSDCHLFDSVTSEIREQRLATTFGVPIDSARASFVLASSTVSSYEEFIETVQAFFVHVQGHVTNEVPRTFNIVGANYSAVALLENAFRNRGGIQAALAMARNGTEGGVRSVLDVLTECYKASVQAEFVTAVIQTAVNDMSPVDRVRFTRGAIQRLGPFLPSELRDQPPERFTRDIEQIVRAYVKSIDSLERLLQTL